jgi:hypothetical protein
MYKYFVVFVVVLFRKRGNRSNGGSLITTRFLAPNKISAFKQYFVQFVMVLMIY